VIENRPRWALSRRAGSCHKAQAGASALEPWKTGKMPTKRDVLSAGRVRSRSGSPTSSGGARAVFGAMQAGRNLPQPRNDASCQSPVAAVAPMRAFRASSAPVKSLKE